MLEFLTTSVDDETGGLHKNLEKAMSLAEDELVGVSGEILVGEEVEQEEEEKSSPQQSDSCAASGVPSGPQPRVLLDYELEQLVSKHVATVEASFYLKLQSQLLLGDAPWARVLVALFCIWLQQFALHTVSAVLFLTWNYAHTDDPDVLDKAFPAGISLPANFKYMVDELFDGRSGASVLGVPVLTSLPLLFCVFAVVLTIHDEVEELRIGFLLVCHRSRLFQPRWLAAWLVGVGRFCLILKFSGTTMQLLGTADGPVNIILNSLALAFILEFDNSAAMVLTAYGPLEHSFFGVLTARRRVKDLLRCDTITDGTQGLRSSLFDILSQTFEAKRTLLLAYNAIERCKPLAFSFLIFNVSFRMQRFACTARLASVDDDFTSHQTTITKHYNWSEYFMAFFLTTSMHLAFVVSSPFTSNYKILLRRIALLVLDIAILILVYETVFRWCNDLVIFNFHQDSYDLWESVSPMPRRQGRHNRNDALP